MLRNAELKGQVKSEMQPRAVSLSPRLLSSDGKASIVNYTHIVQLFSCIRLFVTPWTAVCKASLWAFFGIGVKTDLFQSCGHCWVFQSCRHIECSTFTASCFRIWNSSAGIPSPPLDLFIVMLPKAHLTSHSRMFGCKWVIIPSWLSGSLRSFFV